MFLVCTVRIYNTARFVFRLFFILARCFPCTNAQVVTDLQASRNMSVHQADMRICSHYLFSVVWQIWNELFKYFVVNNFIGVVTSCINKSGITCSVMCSQHDIVYMGSTTFVRNFVQLTKLGDGAKSRSMGRAASERWPSRLVIVISLCFWSIILTRNYYRKEVLPERDRLETCIWQ